MRSGERSAVEVTKEAIGRIAASDPQVGAFLAVSGDQARAAAAKIDAALAAGDARVKGLPLLGLPVAVKDNICTQGDLLAMHASRPY